MSKEKSEVLKASIRCVKPKLRININTQLADDWKNGQADFSTTCQAYEPNGRGRYVESFGGCCHDEILKAAPELKLLVSLHLSDFNGAPMYALANGFYHLWNKDKTEAERLQDGCEYLRITADELKQLARVQDKDYFAYMLESLKIPDRWKTEAAAGIQQLEELTGKKYNPPVYPRSNHTPLSAGESAKIAGLIKSGYYSDSAIKARTKAAIKAKAAARIQSLKNDRDEKIKIARIKCMLKIWLISKTDKLRRKFGDFPDLEDSAIYYDHKNTICFNWRGMPQYHRDLTPANFKQFCGSITDAEFQKLPANIAFETEQGQKFSK